MTAKIKSPSNKSKEKKPFPESLEGLQPVVLEDIKKTTTDKPHEHPLIRYSLLLFVTALIVILGVVTVRLLNYYFNGMPKLAEFYKLFPTMPAKELFENVILLKKQLTDDVIRLFQTIVSSSIVPLVTLFLGYIFGKRI